MSDPKKGDWGAPLSLAELGARSLSEEGTIFRAGQFLYCTTGERVGHGGMGTAYLLQRKRLSEEEMTDVVGKVFHPDYLLQLRTDEATRKEHEEVMRNVDAIAELDHPHLLPTYVSARISDNFLFVSPKRKGTLREIIGMGLLSPSRRVELFMQALSGLSALHEANFLHRDFTIRNILVDEGLQSASLFDFDLSFNLSAVAGKDYKSVFGGRMFGSPGYSMAPEILDAGLMTSRIEAQLDLYAAGATLFSLFTDELPYGKAEDMWSLLLRVGEGVVRGGLSHIQYPDEVPLPLRPIIDSCMQRNPELRPESANALLDSLRKVLPSLSSGKRTTASFATTMRYGDRRKLVELVPASQKSGLPTERIAELAEALDGQGYDLSKALGKASGYPIFVAAPNQDLLTAGRFPDPNDYPKIVTAIDLRERHDREEVVNKWLTSYMPILREARHGLLTSLHRVFYDQDSGFLLVLSEYVEDARFGSDLESQVLELQEVFGLGYLVARQVGRLHKEGLAHNNVTAASLLFKGSRERRCAFPAMVGIVNPDDQQSAMEQDVKNLCSLIQFWLRDNMIEDAGPSAVSRLEVVREELMGLEESAAPTIGELTELCADGLSVIDFNFGVLRESEGDLDEYALLLVGHSIYSRLWGQGSTRAVDRDMA